MCKRYIILLLALVLALMFYSCETENNTSIDTESKGEVTPETAGFTDSDYRFNPRIVALQKIDENTVRVQFSDTVHPESQNITGGVFYSPTESDGSNGESVAAKSVKYCDLTRDSKGIRSATTFDLTFDGAVEVGGYVVFRGSADDNGKSLKHLFLNADGGWIKSDKVNDEEIPYLAVKVTADVITVPETQTRMVCAYLEDKSKGIFLVEFSRPVICADSWTQHVFISDVANPNPGVGESWQYGISSMTPINEQTGEDGKKYASKYRITISADANQIRKLPETGVVRISENDARAAEECASSWNNDDLGRVVTAIDGTPLMADATVGWDVAFAIYSTDAAFAITTE